MIENTVAAIIEMGATLYVRNHFVLRIFHNITLHATDMEFVKKITPPDFQAKNFLHRQFQQF